MSERATATAGAQADMCRVGITWAEVLEALGALERVEDTPAAETRKAQPGAPVRVDGENGAPAGPVILLAVTRTGRRLIVAVENTTVVGVQMATIAETPDEGPDQTPARINRRTRLIIAASAAAVGIIVGVAIALVKNANSKRRDGVEGWSRKEPIGSTICLGTTCCTS